MDYTHTTPTNKKTGGKVGSKLKRTGVASGSHTIEVQKITNVTWSKKELYVGEEIEAKVETMGIKDGSEITFFFYEKDTNTVDVCRGTAKTKISSNQAKAIWKYPENIDLKTVSSKYSLISIYFNVKTGILNETAGQIPVYSDLNIKVEKEDGSAIAKEKVVLHLSNGHISDHSTDASGKIALKKVPPRAHLIQFPNSPRIASTDSTIANFNLVSQKINIVALGSKIHLYKLIDIYIYCAHKINERRRVVNNTNVLEIVPDNKGKDAYKEEVMILSRTAQSLQANGVNLEKKEKEFGMQAFLLKCEQDYKWAPGIWQAEFWKGLVQPKEYQISGLPRPFSVKCYRPDIYKIQIKFPAWRKWSGGSKVESEKAVFKNEIKHRRIPTASHFEFKNEKTGWKAKNIPMPITSEAPLLLFRDETSIKIDFMKSVGAVVELAKNLNWILTLIQKNVPKVGWYVEWENQLFQGTFVVEWGWKEYIDNRAYYYIGMNIDLKLIEMKMEIGVGVSSCAYKVQIFGALTGSVSLSVKTCRYSPDGEQEFSLPFGAEIIGSLGARAQVSCYIKIEGTVETGIKFEDGALKFRQSEGLSAECKLKWSGITAKLNISGGTGKKEGTDEDFGNQPKEMNERSSAPIEHEIIGSAVLKKWEWSQTRKAEYNPTVIPRADLHDMLVSKLEEGDNIRVKEKSGLVLNTYMSIDEVAKHIEEKIYTRNDILKDPKTAEALVFDIRKILQPSINQNVEWNHMKHMDRQQFDSFVNIDMNKILDKYIDPMQTMINQCSKQP